MVNILLYDSYTLWIGQPTTFLFRSFSFLPSIFHSHIYSLSVTNLLIAQSLTHPPTPTQSTIKSLINSFNPQTVLFLQKQSGNIYSFSYL